MCSNYRPVTRVDRLLTFFGVERDREVPEEDVWPLGLAPFIRLAPDGSGRTVVQDGMFGLLPGFAAEVAYGRRTYNARSETVATLPSFEASWAAGQRCIVPSEIIFEPDWSTGRAVRWAIQQPGQVPMGVAGIYRPWRRPDGRELLTFAMLTVNADGHPVMQQFHRPGEEKRMVVILAPADYGEWLTCAVDEAPQFFRRWSGPLDTYAAELPPRPPTSRVKKPKQRPAPPPLPPLEQDDLF